MTKNGDGRMRWLLRAGAATVVGMIMVASYATPSFASQVWYSFENRKGTPGALPLYLTIGGGLKGQATVHDRIDSATQEWTFQDSGSYVFIRSGASPQQWALSVLGNNPANGTPVVQYTYQPTNSYQKWSRESVNGDIRYRNLGTNKCLAVTGGTASTLPNGSGVIIYDCGIGWDQLWVEHYLFG